MVIAADIARELGYGLATDLTKHLDADEKGMCPVHTLGGDQSVAIISEAGVYRAIVQRKLNKKQHDHSLFEKVSRFQRLCFTMCCRQSARQDRIAQRPLRLPCRISPNPPLLPVHGPNNTKHGIWPRRALLSKTS